ncbi:hypothetical protein [Devosia sp. 2618]|uniref:hypothetical protein n=1 Tax=Devosia sp. 2618 TaxID=3156454 RepID=UPI00339A43B5
MNYLIDFETERTTVQIVKILGRQYRPIEADAPPELLSFTLYYDRPGIASAGTNVPSECIGLDHAKIEYVLQIHLGSSWSEHAILKSSREPAFLDDGTFVVVYLLVIRPERDFFQGDVFRAEQMFIDCELNAGFILNGPLTVQDAVRMATVGPDFDVNLLKGFARDIDPEELDRLPFLPLEDLYPGGFDDHG